MNAIEAAAQAALETTTPDGDCLGDWLEVYTDDNLAVAKDFTTAAIIAFLRNCEVSDEMIASCAKAYGSAEDMDYDDIVSLGIKSAIEQLAAELEGNCHERTAR
jgi:hypothetical protein